MITLRPVKVVNLTTFASSEGHHSSAMAKSSESRHEGRHLMSLLASSLLVGETGASWNVFHKIVLTEKTVATTTTIN